MKNDPIQNLTRSEAIFYLVALCILLGTILAIGIAAVVVSMS